MRIKQNLFFLLFSALLVMGVGCKKVCTLTLRCGYEIGPNLFHPVCFNLNKYSDYNEIPNNFDSLYFVYVFDTTYVIETSNRELIEQLKKGSYECD